MYRQLTRRLRTAHRRDERGAVAVIMAFSLVLLCVVGATVLDFGLARVDRQIDQSAADSATLAGLHSLNIGDGSAHPYIGVCTALRYLKVNTVRLSGLNDSTGWKNGVGAATGSGCSDTNLRLRVCSTSDKSTWAVWHGTTSSDGVSYDVTVQSGYSLGTLATSTWPDDKLAASNPDTSQHGCDQLAVTVKQSRGASGLGRLTGVSKISTRIRSVGRIKQVPGKNAPALLLLRQTGCPVLETGNSGGGSGTFIHVLGAISTSSGISQPGTIHSDSDGSNCTGGSNQSIFLGHQNDGIVAYAAPLVANPSQPDPAKPGQITSVAAANGITGTVIRDNLNYVYGSSALNSGGTKNEVTGRQLVTRGLVDQRYFTGVKAALSGAASVFSTAPTGFSATLTNCSPTQANINALGLNATKSLYIKCPANGGFTGASTGLTINAGTVFFSGVVNPSGTLSMPNATHVYVAGLSTKTDAINLGGGAGNTSFQMNNSASNLSGTTCSNGQNSSKATLFVQTGDIRENNGGNLQLCRTTVFMMGGRADGCVPATMGNAPSSTPCAGGLGTGQFTQQGGNIDWTAPDTLDQTLDSTANPLPAALTAWADPNGPEDLALWSESGSNSSTTYNMAGGGTFHVRGVYMVPNAQPFIISGGSLMNLTNAQYIVSSIQLNGGTQIIMSVDPNSAVTLPDIGLVGLIR